MESKLDTLFPGKLIRAIHWVLSFFPEKASPSLRRLKFYVWNGSISLWLQEQIQVVFDSLNKCFIHSHLTSFKQLGEACKDGQNYIAQVPAAVDKTNWMSERSHRPFFQSTWKNSGCQWHIWIQTCPETYGSCIPAYKSVIGMKIKCILTAKSHHPFKAWIKIWIVLQVLHKNSKFCSGFPQGTTSFRRIYPLFWHETISAT